MRIPQLYDWLENHQRVTYLFMVPTLLLLMAGVYVLVYTTGGIKYVYSHSMYLPILLSGFVFGLRAGVLVGLVGGIILGPLMPIDVTTGEPQKTFNWLYRTGFFMLSGFIAGGMTQYYKYNLGKLKWLALHDVDTHLPNRRAFIEQLKRISNKQANPSAVQHLALVDIENEKEIAYTFGSGAIDEAILQLIGHARQAVAQEIFTFRANAAQIGSMPFRVEARLDVA
jgi:hypothetical protein